MADADRDAEIDVRSARDRYLAANGLTMDGYGARWFVPKLGPIPVPLPNPGLLHLHDLHHVATGFDTDLLGEAEISLYELRGGCRTVVIHILCFGAIFFGLLLAPGRMLRAWTAARGAHTLYVSPRDYEALLGMTVAELRESLKLPRDGLVSPRRDEP